MVRTRVIQMERQIKTISQLKITPNPFLSLPSTAMPRRNVAVIGAGAAGLSAANSLRRENHTVVVFETQSKPGGTWQYTDKTEPDPISSDPNRIKVHTSLYKSLRTNLPREVMGFREYPFLTRPEYVLGKIKYPFGKDPRMYPGHEEVLGYLEGYCSEFGLGEMVRFGCEVDRVWVEGGRWRVRWRRRESGDEFDEEVFDAVVVCNGHYSEPRVAEIPEELEEFIIAVVVCNRHYSEPRVAEIPGIQMWPGKQIHSHNYRVPEPYKGQVVVLIGSSASAVDISREIAEVAKEVHIASRSANEDAVGKLSGFSNLWLHQMIKRVHQDGTMDFLNGSTVRADIILHCTGYKYQFPFLNTNGVVSVDDNRVGPLYKHVFPPLLAPWLSFVGLPWKVAPFPLFEFQTKWIAGVLSGKITLPSPSEMMTDVDSFYKDMEVNGIPKRYTHNMSDYQFEYNDWLANECGSQPSEEWRKKMYFASSKGKKECPESYRDEWDDQESLQQAHEDFANYHRSKDLQDALLTD